MTVASTFRSCQVVYLVQWNELKGTFQHRRTEMARKYATEFIKKRMAFETLGEAILRVGKLNDLLNSGESEDHFITPVGVHDGM